MDKQEPDVEQRKNEEGNWTMQYIAAVSASLATFSTGIVFGWPSQITDNLLNDEVGFTITSNDLGWICSASSIGASFLTIFMGPLCDRIGRKLTMLLLISVFELGWALIIFSCNVELLILGRFVTGMAGGSYCVTVSLYIGEVAQKEVRGRLGGLTQFMISCGILFSNVTGAYLSVRHFSMACAAVPLIFGILFITMPETPIYLLRKGRIEDSKTSLRVLLGKHYVDDEYETLKKHLKIDSEQLSTREILRKRSAKKACVIGLGLAMLKVFSGIDSVTSYLSHIFGKTDTELGPKLASMIFSAFQIFAVVPQTLLVDRMGRKILLIFSQVLMGVCLGATALSLLIEDEDIILQYVPIVALCLFTTGFSIGIGPIGWIITAEIFEDKIKGRAMSVCTFVVWFLAFISVKIFGILEDQWGIYVPLFLYSGISLVGALFVFICVPETKNKSSAEIEKILSNR